MKKIYWTVILLALIAPLSLFASSFTITALICHNADCGDATPPTVPADLSATAVSFTEINLSWTASVDPDGSSPPTGMAGYKIYRDGAYLTSVSGTSYSDTGLQPGQLYSYTVSAFDQRANESDQSPTVSATTFAYSTNAPNPSAGSPTGTLAIGTTQTLLSLVTDVAANCKYGRVAGTTYVNLPYVFATTGSTTHSTMLTGLTNGNTYTYYIRCQSLYGYPMTSDYIVSFAIPAPQTTVGAGGGGGGGSGPSYVPTNTINVIARGVAYPGSKVTLTKDGQFVGSSQAGPDARFEIDQSGIGDGTFTFGVSATDYRGVKSSLFTFTVSLTSGVTTVISGIFIPPTISIDKQEVRRGDPLTVIGQSAPQAIVSMLFHSAEGLVKSTNADSKGLWAYQFDTLNLDYGKHTTQARSATGTDISTFSQLLGFTVGTKNVDMPAAVGCKIIGDLNGDCRVDLADFSIMLYWYHRDNPPAYVDLSGDGKIDLIDFSILAYHWTG